ncbi:MAG: nitrate reductase molybdenum cofactor assembly chaperone [Propionibacteriaceae bacterium]|nr:nitrate reductase molybdenum cofactor assembly chaperone [Propionibacteriaceae bacterium]
MESSVVFSAAALLLSYPDEELLGRLDEIEDALAATSVADLFAPTISHLRTTPLMEAQSFHVQEFDLSRRHALHLTYWTDGDTRRRGEALWHFKQVYRDSGLLVDLAGELPDHLPVVLEFAVTEPTPGRALLERYRVSLELLRIGLTEDRLPQAGVITAVCRMLGGPSPQTRAEVAKLLEGPPTETVGMGTDLLPYPQFLGQ